MKNKILQERIETVEIEFPSKFKRFSLIQFCWKAELADLVSKNSNRIFLLNDELMHEDGQYSSVVLRDAGDKKHYYAAFLHDGGVIEEKRLSYDSIVVILVGDGETLHKKNYRILRYQ